VTTADIIKRNREPIDPMNDLPQSRTHRVIAHRAGNDPDVVVAALKRADLVELDAHVFRGRVEVRHTKVLRPTSRLWEKWYLLPAGTPVHALHEILAVMPPDVPIHVDLKCFTRRAGRLIRQEIPEERELIVSCRSWWVLRAFRDRPQTLMMRSCGSSLQLRLVRLFPGLGDRVGVVAHQRLLDPAVVASLHEQTPHVFTWAVETVKRGRALVSWGVTGLIVDDLEIDWARLHIENGTDPLLN